MSRGVSLGPKGDPEGSFGLPFGCILGTLWTPWVHLGLPLELLALPLGILGLPLCSLLLPCGVLWVLGLVQLTYAIQNKTKMVWCGMVWYGKIGCGTL